MELTFSQSYTFIAVFLVYLPSYLGQTSYLFRLRVKLPPVTTSLTTQR